MNDTIEVPIIESPTGAEEARIFLPHHYEVQELIAAPAETVFAYADDQARFSSHMNQSSWKMGGGRMTIELDRDNGKVVGSKIRLAGRILGMQLSVDEVVTERIPPRRKVWATTGVPTLLVIGHYRMGFDITPQSNASILRVFIDYALPQAGAARWLGYCFGRYYARWCTRQMLADAVRHFEK